jgi:starch synthase
MQKTKVLFVSQEIFPVTPESTLANQVRQIPQAMHERGKETRIFMPRFGKINERRHQLHEVIRLSGMNLIVDDTDHPLIIKVASIPQIRLQVYFIDNEEFFHRKAYLHDEAGKPFSDNGERMIFFSKGVLETVKKLGWAPDIVHCHGWFSALMPLYVKHVFAGDPHFAESKIVVSLYKDDFAGSIDKGLSKKVQFDQIGQQHLGDLSTSNYVNLMKVALAHADGVVIHEADINPKLMEEVNNLSVPVLKAYECEDFHGAIDEFFDTIHAAKPILID